MKNSRVDQCEWVTIPTATDSRGCVSWLQEGAPLPFAPKRIYYLHALEKDILRGEHGHKDLQQIIIGLGKIDLEVEDGLGGRRIFNLNSKDRGVFIAAGLWRRVIPKEDGAICLVIASEEYSESDYMRDFNEFSRWKRS